MFLEVLAEASGSPRYAPLRGGNEVAASAMAAAVVFTGTRLTHSAALALLDPHAPARQVTHVMRDLGRSSHDVGTLHGSESKAGDDPAALQR